MYIFAKQAKITPGFEPPTSESASNTCQPFMPLDEEVQLINLLLKNSPPK